MGDRLALGNTTEVMQDGSEDQPSKWCAIVESKEYLHIVDFSPLTSSALTFIKMLRAASQTIDPTDEKNNPTNLFIPRHRMHKEIAIITMQICIAA